MPGQVEIHQEITVVDVTGGRRTWGDRTKPITYALSTGYVEQRTKQLAANAKTDLWLAADEPSLGDFELLLVKSDQDGVILELETDTGNEVGNEWATIELKKNIWFILCSDGSWANYTADFAAGTLDTIEVIRARQVSGGTTANVVLIIAT
jgi:hypothetical protein